MPGFWDPWPGKVKTIIVRACVGRVPWVGVGALTSTVSERFHPTATGVGGLVERTPITRVGRDRSVSWPAGRRRQFGDGSVSKDPCAAGRRRYDPAMAPSRARRRVVLLTIVASAVGAVAAFRRRELARNAEEFHARYG